MNLAPLLARRADPLAYVISRAREALCAPGAELTTGPGMFHHVLDLGARHPLAIAVGNAASVVDGTLGLAKDALHIAQLTGAAVTGLEGSLPLATLAEAGLQRLARDGAPWSPAAARVTVVAADAREWLATRLRCVDVVYLDPLFETPGQAAPGFELLRRLALPTPLEHLLEVARRAAKLRVVVRLPRAVALPPGATRVRGQAVDYAVIPAG